MNINLNSLQVTEYATKHNTDRYTAMAMIAAKDYGIRPDEMEAYMSRFHEYMSKSFGVLASIHHALMNIILNAGFQKIEASKTAPEAPKFHYQFSTN